MSYKSEIRMNDRHRRERRVWRNGLAVSAIVHLLVFFAWRITAVPISPYVASGPRQGEDRADEGSLRALSIRVPPNLPIVPPPIPLPNEIEIQEVDLALTIEGDAFSLLGERPGFGEPLGLADGAGMPPPGNSTKGLSALMPATPRGMIIPTTKRGLRGTEIQVWVFIDEAGRVIADSTRLDPPTEDHDFNQSLIQQAAGWSFRPATREGKPVASWFPYRITME